MLSLSWFKNEIDKSRTQLAGNIRLQAGLWLILVLGLLYGNLLLSDYRAEKNDEWLRLERLAKEQQQLTEDDQWEERLAQVRDLLQKQEAQFAIAESEAYGRADVQAFVTEVLGRQGLKRVRMEVSTATKVDNATGLLPLQIHLSGEATITQLMPLLYQLETARPSYHVDSLNVQSRNSDNITFNLLATIWFIPWDKDS